MSKWANRSFFWENCTFALLLTKTSDSLKKIWLKSYFWYVFLNKRFAHCLFFNEQFEQIAQVAHQKLERFAQVAHQKWASMSESLRSRTKNERMSELLFFWSESLIRSFFSQTTSNLPRKPMSEFPTLHMVCLFLIENISTAAEYLSINPNKIWYVCSWMKKDLKWLSKEYGNKPGSRA